MVIVWRSVLGTARGILKWLWDASPPASPALYPLAAQAMTPLNVPRTGKCPAVSRRSPNNTWQSCSGCVGASVNHTDVGHLVDMTGWWVGLTGWWVDMWLIYCWAGLVCWLGVAWWWLAWRGGGLRGGGLRGVEVACVAWRWSVLVFEPIHSTSGGFSIFYIGVYTFDINK